MYTLEGKMKKPTKNDLEKTQARANLENTGTKVHVLALSLRVSVVA